jgi:hypothetical protein
MMSSVMQTDQASVDALREIAQELRLIREALEAQYEGSDGDEEEEEDEEYEDEDEDEEE